MKLSLSNQLKSKDNKRLLGNFSSLLSVRMINIIQPLIVLPYLTRTIGPEMYGLIAFAQAFIKYFEVLIEYGFNLTATRDISINRESPEKVNKIYSNVLTAKFYLFLISFAAILLIVLSYKKFEDEWLLYLFCTGLMFENLLFPIWYFQGIEQMKFISYLNVASKLFFTIFVFIFVKNQDDYLFVPLLSGLGFISIGIISLIIIRVKFKVKYYFPPFRDAIITIKEGFAAFIANLTPNLYNNTATFLLGLFTNNLITGYYAATLKVVNLFITFITILTQTFFPHLAKHKGAFKKFMKILLLTSISFTIAIIIGRNILVNLLLGNDFKVVASYLLLFSVTVFLNAFNSGYGRTFLLINHKDILLRNINIILSVIGFFLVYGLTYKYGIWGVLCGLISTRLLFAIIYYFHYNRLKTQFL